MTIADVGAMPDRAEVESAERLRSRGVQRIPVSAVIVEERIRQDMGDIAGLAESILKSGLLHPIVVDESYRLLAGERRLRAHVHAGLDEIEARVFAGLTDLEKEVVELHENERRKDFASNELARYYVQKEEIYREGHPDPKGGPGSGWAWVEAEPPPKELARLIERHAAPYPDAERRAWIEGRLRVWWEQRNR